MNVLEMLQRQERELCEKYSTQYANAVSMRVKFGSALLCRVLGKYLLYTDPADISMTPHLAMSGHWEMWVTMAIARNVSPGGRYIDVGAAYGYYTLLLADLAGDAGQVEALEPNRYQRHLLNLSTEVNGFAQRVQVREQAAWDSVTEINFGNDPMRVGCSGALEFHEGRKDELVLDVVYASPLDTLLMPETPRERPVDFVKIDVEGAELRVWNGMQTMRRNPNIQILMELTPRHHPNGGRAMLEEAQREGFGVHEIDADGYLKAAKVEEVTCAEGPDLRMIWLKRGKK